MWVLLRFYSNLSPFFFFFWWCTASLQHLFFDREEKCNFSFPFSIFQNKCSSVVCPCVSSLTLTATVRSACRSCVRQWRSWWESRWPTERSTRSSKTPTSTETDWWTSRVRETSLYIDEISTSSSSPSHTPSCPFQSLYAWCLADRPPPHWLLTGKMQLLD